MKLNEVWLHKLILGSFILIFGCFLFFGCMKHFYFDNYGNRDAGYYGVINLTSKEFSDIETVNFSGAEPWGRWSDGSPAVIKVPKSFPQNFRCIITVTQAFGPNLNKPIQVLVGNISKSFDANSKKSIFELEFKGVEVGTRLITINIPNPTSPKQLGISEDIRELGIGIEKIEIAHID